MPHYTISKQEIRQLCGIPSRKTFCDRVRASGLLRHIPDFFKRHSFTVRELQIIETKLGIQSNN
jgi:hypothetical protein